MPGSIDGLKLAYAVRSRANDFLEAQIERLQADVSKGYARGYHHGRFNTYTG
jgi:hypothetical protein